MQLQLQKQCATFIYIIITRKTIQQPHGQLLIYQERVLMEYCFLCVNRTDLTQGSMWHACIINFARGHFVGKILAELTIMTV